MQQVLLANDQTLRVVRIPGEAGVFSFIEFTSPLEARSYLQEYQGDAEAMEQMRWALAEDTHGFSIGRMSDAEVIDQLAHRVVLRQMQVVEELEEELVVAEPEQLDASTTSEPPPPLPRAKKLTWIEVKVVWDSTGKPVKNVRLVVKTPDGVENFHDTNGEGKVRIEEIEEGSCDVRCAVKGVTRETALHFMGTGEPKNPVPEPSNGKKPASGTLMIVDVKHHKVKKGESLDNLAKKVGLTWKELSKFNWGTDEPKKVNLHLKYDVGCTKKTADGKNLVFDDSDDPGLIEIPAPWFYGGLATGQTHVLRVKPCVVIPPWYFSV